MADDRKERAGEARAIARHHFGTGPSKLKELTGGLTNSVFELSVAREAYVIRIAQQSAKLQDFTKEQWVTERARQAGIPAAEILEVGEKIIERPYMLQRKVAGIPGDQHPGRHALLAELGRIARGIHRIRTKGFGTHFDWSKNVLSKKQNWRSFLLEELNVWGRLKTLEAHKMLEPRRRSQLRTCIKLALGLRVPGPRLNHGDLRLKNVLADESGKILAVIDWENACSNFAPLWDLSIALHDLTVDEKQCFIDGYGLRFEELRKLSPVMKMLNVLNYAPYVEELAHKNQRHLLELYRLRLNGYLSLYVQ